MTTCAQRGSNKGQGRAWAGGVGLEGVYEPGGGAGDVGAA
jgi:hypothetical protein